MFGIVGIRDCEIVIEAVTPPDTVASLRVALEHFTETLYPAITQNNLLASILPSKYTIMGGGQTLERRNVERPIFRNFKIANIKIMKDVLFDNFIFEFNF